MINVSPYKNAYTRIRKWKKANILGKGAFGVVYLVEKKGTKELYAMKSINKEDIVNKDQIEHTKAEKMILEHINFPYLVGLAYAFQTPSKLYFIMQFMRKNLLIFRWRRTLPAFVSFKKILRKTSQVLCNAACTWIGSSSFKRLHLSRSEIGKYSDG